MNDSVHMTNFIFLLIADQLNNAAIKNVNKGNNRSNIKYPQTKASRVSTNKAIGANTGDSKKETSSSIKLGGAHETVETGQDGQISVFQRIMYIHIGQKNLIEWILDSIKVVNMVGGSNKQLMNIKEDARTALLK